MPEYKETFQGRESVEVKKQQGTAEKAAESATAAVESGTLREAFGVLNESGESAEDGAEAMGHVSERSREGNENKGDAFGTSTKGDDVEKAEVVRQTLIHSKPSKKKMLNDIRKHFQSEQKVLQKDLRKYQRTGDWHRYNGVVARLRAIKEVLSNAMHMTYDALKNAWLKVVHNIV